MVDVVHRCHDGAMLEGQVVLDVLADFQDLLPGELGVDPARLGLGDLDLGELLCEEGLDLFLGGALIHGFCVHAQSSRNAPLLK